MIKRNLPYTASVATRGEGARMVAPAASRNSDALCNLLVKVAPAQGKALELASGTGQHVAAFAARMPELQWQPTEIDPDRRASIDAYTSNCENVFPAATLDATIPGWHKQFRDQNLIVLINLLHLISRSEAEILLAEAAQALAPEGRLVVYGPFKRKGRLTSEGDARFHEALIRQDPEIGYKDDTQVAGYLKACHLTPVRALDMPANNLVFVAERPAI